MIFNLLFVAVCAVLAAAKIVLLVSVLTLLTDAAWDMLKAILGKD